MNLRESKSNIQNIEDKESNIEFKKIVPFIELA